MSTPLNPAQRDAIRYLDGPCLVIAGAGSGKTRVITHKIAHLVDSGVQASSIAAITFTNKAAQEMQERLGALVKLPERQRPLVSTFHSLGVQIVRSEARALGLKPAFSILDADDSGGILQQALATTDRKLLRAAQTRISLWKNAMVEPAAALELAGAEARHHRLGLLLVVLAGDHRQRVAGAQLRPQRLFMQLRVVRDQPVGRLQDVGAGTVVLLELDDP